MPPEVVEGGLGQELEGVQAGEVLRLPEGRRRQGLQDGVDDVEDLLVAPGGAAAEVGTDDAGLERSELCGKTEASSCKLSVIRAD